MKHHSLFMTVAFLLTTLSPLHAIIPIEAAVQDDKVMQHLSPSSAVSRIIETMHFSEIASHLTPETLVILDIDDTLLIPTQMLGCDEWFLSRMKLLQDSGWNYCEALEKALQEWEAIRHLSQMELVEPNTHTIVQELQAKGHHVMGLTTQGLALATRTRLQLKEHEIDLLLTAPTQDDHYFQINGHGVLYRNGILFSSGKHKGTALFQLLDTIGYSPKHIVFINDKAANLKEVAITAAERDVPFTGLRYAYSDARKARFSRQLTDIQFKYSSFEHILSDREAEALQKQLAIEEKRG